MRTRRLIIFLLLLIPHISHGANVGTIGGVSDSRSVGGVSSINGTTWGPSPGNAVSIMGVMASGFPNVWTRQCPLTIQHAKVTADQVNFPVLVGYNCVGNETNLPDEMIQTGNQYAAQSDGGDIRFTLDAAGNTPLHSEIVIWSQNATLASAKAEIWVKLPNVYSGSDVTFYVWYHTSTAQPKPAAGDATWGSQGVWSNGYIGVWHLQESASPALDSSSTGTSVPSSGSPTFGAAGKVGAGVTTSGNIYLDISNFLSTSSGSALALLNSNMTVSMWAKPSSTLGAGRRLVCTGGSYLAEGWGLTENGGTSPVALRFAALGQTTAQMSNTEITTGSWTYVVATKDGTNLRSYTQGTKQDTIAQGYSTGSPGADFSIGGLPGNQMFDGTLDEVRVANVVRSDTWISTEYNNQSDPGSFITRGTPTSL